MKRKATIILVGLLLTSVVFAGLAIAGGGDNNCNTNGEDGNYEENNENPFDDDTFPGEGDRQRSGVVWP